PGCRVLDSRWPAAALADALFATVRSFPMSTTMSHEIPSSPRATTAAYAGPAYTAYRILQVGFAVLPIAAGLDKFAHVLVDWNQYLSPEFARLVPWNVERIMMGVGVVEVLAGLLVAFAPRVGGFLVA